MLSFNQTLLSFQNVRGNVKFSYAIAKNTKLMEVEVEAITNLTKEYDEKVINLIREYAVKDDDGQIVFEDAQRNLPKYTNREELETKLEELYMEYKETVDEVEKIKDEDIDIDFYKIPLSSFEGLYIMNGEKKTDIQLSAAELSIFEPMIDDSI